MSRHPNLRFGSHLTTANVTTIDFDTAALHQTLYWGLPTPIWSVPHSSYELMRRTASISGALLPD